MSDAKSMASSACAGVYSFALAEKDHAADPPDNPDFGFDLSWRNATKACVRDNPICVSDNPHKRGARHLTFAISSD